MTLANLNPNRILIILHGSIGDVTRALPLANLVRRRFPDAFLAWSVEPVCYPLLQNQPALDEIILFDRRHGWRDFLPFLRQIRSRRFDLVLDLQRHFKSGIISFFSRAAVRLGFSRSDSKELNWIFNNTHIAALGEQISKLEHYLKFAECLDARAPVEWRFNLTREEELAVTQHLARARSSHAALFVGSRWESKQWFPDQIADCARVIHQRFGLDVVLLGGEGDQKAAAEAAARSGVPVINLVGQTSLREAIGIIARAKVSVGPDTGLMHISAAVGTPVVSLWGATSPLRNGPYRFEELAIRGRAACSPCFMKTCPIGRLCMRSIATEAIAEKVAFAVRSNVEIISGYGTAS